MDNNNPVSFQEEKPKQTKTEKIIVVVLAVIFIGVLLGVFWDLYGKKLLSNYICTSQNTTSNNNLKTTSKPTETPKTPDNQVVPTNEQSNSKQTNPTITNNPAPKIDSNVAYSSYSTCLENTKDGPAAKDCCDCLSADVSVRKACRDATVNYDFSKNTVIKTFTIPSKLGRTGDYSAYTASGNQQECKQECETSTTLVCGDFQYCRTACDNLSQ